MARLLPGAPTIDWLNPKIKTTQPQAVAPTPAQAQVPTMRNQVPQRPTSNVPSQPPSNVPFQPQSTWPAYPDLGIIGKDAAFGSDRPGEKILYDAVVSPLARTGEINLDLIKELYGQMSGTGYATNYLGGIMPQLQSLFGITPEQRASMLGTYQQAMSPQRQQAVSQLQNAAASMGLGGGRLSRALAEQQRGFGSEDLQLVQQLLGADISGRQSAASTGSGLLGNQLGARNALLSQALQNITGIGSELAKAPLWSMEAFKPMVG